MSKYLSDLGLVADAIFDMLSQLFSLMMMHPVLTAVLALWALDRIFGIFEYLKG